MPDVDNQKSRAKAAPFVISPQRLPWRDAEIAARVAAIRMDAERRLAGMAVIEDGRRGFGLVYARGAMRTVGGDLTWWVWRHPDPEHCPAWLSAETFADDPIGADATDSLATRTVAASAFAQAANAFFDPEDVRFHVRPVEVVAAGAERPAGFHRGGDADVLAVDLMAGMPNPKIIDHLVAAEHKGDLEQVMSMGWDCTWLRVNVWHRAERLNAARAMFDPTLPPIRVPGIASLRRRMQATERMLRGG